MFKRLNEILCTKKNCTIYPSVVPKCYAYFRFLYAQPCGSRHKMSKELLKKRKVTTAETVKSLGENGIKVSEKDAEIILDFLYFLAKLTVNQYFNKDKKQ